MKHKTLFRLALKAIGILLLGFCVPQLVETIGFMLYIFSDSRRMALRADAWLYSLARPAGGVVQVAFALYLLFGAKWIVDRCIPSNRPYCPECGYDLSNNRATSCAECGVTLPRGLGRSSPSEEATVTPGGGTYDESPHHQRETQTRAPTEEPPPGGESAAASHR